jgi:hypothetical protein
LLGIGGRLTIKLLLQRINNGKNPKKIVVGTTNPYKKDDAQQLKVLVICCQSLHAHLES